MNHSIRASVPIGGRYRSGCSIGNPGRYVGHFYRGASPMLTQNTRQPGIAVLSFVLLSCAPLLASCAVDTGDRRLGISVDERRVQGQAAPKLVRGPTFLRSQSSPTVDSDGDGRRDTYGPSDVVEVRVGYSKQVCGFGVMKLALQTGDGPTVTRDASYCGCGSRGVSFCYRVKPGDRDGDGLAIPGNAISLTSYDGMVPDSKHRPVPSQRDHRVDGRLADATHPSLRSAPGITSKPSVGKVYLRGEKIRVTAYFSEFVEVNAEGGWPTLSLEVGVALRHAVYSGDGPRESRHSMNFLEDAHLVHFEYEVREGDSDRDGTVWVPANGLRIPPGSSIRDLAGNDASVTWSVSSGHGAYIDGG